MNKHPRACRAIRLIAAVASAACFALPATAETQRPHAEITVLPDHYVFKGQKFDDLDALQDAVNAGLPWIVRIEGCGIASRAYLAAAHRFRHLYLELRALESSAPSCQPAPVARLMPVSLRTGQQPSGIDDDAVNGWWNTLMP